MVMAYTNWPVLFREVIAVYCGNRTKHLNTVCPQNADFLDASAGGTCTYHRALKGSGGSSVGIKTRL